MGHPATKNALYHVALDIEGRRLVQARYASSGGKK
jgi:hypothetical protein